MRHSKNPGLFSFKDNLCSSLEECIFLLCLYLKKKKLCQYRSRCGCLFIGFSWHMLRPFKVFIQLFHKFRKVPIDDIASVHYFLSFFSGTPLYLHLSISKIFSHYFHCFILCPYVVVKILIYFCQ